MSPQRLLAAFLALAGLAVVMHFRRRELVRVPALEPAKRQAPQEPELEREQPPAKTRTHGLGWTLVVLGCTAAVAGGAFALALRTALWHQPAVAPANAAPEEAPSPGLEISHVGFAPGELDIEVSNPQDTSARIGFVTVDDAIVAFHVTGSPTVAASGTRQVVVRYDWVAGQPVSVGVTTGTGIESTTDAQAPAA